MKRTIRLVVVWVVTLITVLGAAAAAAPQDAKAQSDSTPDDKFIKPQVVQGCYALTLSPWFPDLRLGEDEEFITPPPRIQLFAEKGTDGPESNGYLVRPAPGVTPTVHRYTYWVPKGPKSLEIVFSTGMSGLEMSVKTLDSETFRGRAVTHWDFARKKQTAQVTANRVPCGKQ